MTWFGWKSVGAGCWQIILCVWLPFFLQLLFCSFISASLVNSLFISFVFFFPFGFLFFFFFFALIFSLMCSVLCSIFSSLLDPPICSPVLSPFDLFLPLPFKGFHATYLPRTMIRPGDIVFQSDWGTNNPVHVGLPFISMRAWEIYPYLSRIVIFMKIRFSIWVVVRLGCRCFTISFPSL
jgi:hypothetical protein